MLQAYQQQGFAKKMESDAFSVTKKKKRKKSDAFLLLNIKVIFVNIYLSTILVDYIQYFRQ